MQLYNNTRELVKVQQFKHLITDKITSTNRINSWCKWFVTDADGKEGYCVQTGLAFFNNILSIISWKAGGLNKCWMKPKVAYAWVIGPVISDVINCEL